MTYATSAGRFPATSSAYGKNCRGWATWHGGMALSPASGEADQVPCGGEGPTAVPAADIAPPLPLPIVRVSLMACLQPPERAVPSGKERGVAPLA